MAELLIRFNKILLINAILLISNVPAPNLFQLSVPHVKLKELHVSRTWDIPAVSIICDPELSRKMFL